jgi:hypothetical protein
VNYVAPASVIEILMSLIVAALVITWVTIIVTHLHFRKARMARDMKSDFPAPFAPSELSVPSLHGADRWRHAADTGHPSVQASLLGTLDSALPRTYRKASGQLGFPSRNEAIRAQAKDGAA